MQKIYCLQKAVFMRWFLTSLGLLMFACNKERVEYKYKVQLKPFTEDEIFMSQSIKTYLFDAEELNTDSLKGIAKKEFLTAIDFYKNKKDLEKAKLHLIKSIMTYPDAKSYYELGNLYLAQYDAKNNASRAFGIAEDLGYKPVSEIYFKQACTYYKAYESGTDEYAKSSSLQYIKRMFDAGAVDTLKIRTDKLLTSITADKEYRVMLASFSGLKSINSKFEVFSGAFELVQGELVIKKEDAELEQSNVSISYDYSDYIPEMENVSFGRDVSHDFYYVARFNLSPDFVTLVYKSKSFYGEYMPTSTYLVNYDLGGKVIDKILLACTCSSEKVKCGTVKGTDIVVEEYSRIWEKDLKEVYIGDNVVKEYKPVASMHYSINPSGKIVKGNETSQMSLK